MNTAYEAVIGLEIHVELLTESKMFCGCQADWFGKEANSNTCPVCLALPGSLPVANSKAIEWAMLVARSLGCTINSPSKFDRKHYFYPDLPKAYQISQYDQPIGVNGRCEYVVIDHKTKTFEEKVGRIHRVHLEEDTGKLSHDESGSYVDYNRAGVPLLEIVTEPDFHTPEEVKAFLEELHARIVVLGVSDANLDQGSMRLEPNISVRKVGEKALPNYKVEVKNINSFRFAAAAVAYEIPRHIELLEKGEIPIQETRGYNEDKKMTVSQRTKENAHDYRYFPEPDLPAFSFTDEDLRNADATIQKKLTESKNTLGFQKKLRYEHILSEGFEQGIAFDIAFTELALIPTFDEVMTGNWDKNFKLFALNELRSSPSKGIELLRQDYEKNKKLKKDVEAMNSDEGKERIEQAISKVINLNQDAVANYTSGKTSALMFLVGQVMKEMKGKAPAEMVKDMLEQRLESSQS